MTIAAQHTLSMFFYYYFNVKDAKEHSALLKDHLSVTKDLLKSKDKQVVEVEYQWVRGPTEQLTIRIILLCFANHIVHCVTFYTIVPNINIQFKCNLSLYIPCF